MSRKMAADGRRYPNIRKSGDRMIYIKLFLDYLEAIEPLGDAERGRLFTALLQYARPGEAPHLGGNERFLFPMMRAQIDRDSAEYKDYCEKQAENGKKGGRPKKPKNPPLSGKPTASQKSQDKDEDKDEDKDKDEDGGKDNAPARDPAVAAVMSAYLDKINPQLSERSRDELAGFVQAMGAEVCLRAIDTALDAKKASWPYVRAILQAKQGSGVRCLADWDDLEENRRKNQEKQKTSWSYDPGSLEGSL